MQAGSLRFRVDADTPDEASVGRLWVDAHPVSEAIALDEVIVRGMVEAIELVPLRYRLTGNVGIPSGQLDPVPARSTLERDLIKKGALNVADDLVQVELLVWLRTSDG